MDGIFGLVKNNIVTPISKISKYEKKISLFIFISSLIFVYGIYNYFDKWGSLTSYIDNITTAIFFVGMWLMAKRKIENWIFLDYWRCNIGSLIFLQRINIY